MSNGLCPSCGATINIPEGANEVQCEYCKTLVKEEEATREFKEISKAPYGSLLLIADTALEAGNFSEAYTYYNKVIEISPTFADAWLKKGIAMVRMSTIGNLKISEALGSWKAAMKWAKKPETMRKRVALEINSTVTDFYPVLENHFLKFRTADDALSEHLSRFIILESTMDYAIQLDKNPKIIRNAIDLCDKVLASSNRAVSLNIEEVAEREIQRQIDLNNRNNEIDNIGEGGFKKILNSMDTFVKNCNVEKEIRNRAKSHIESVTSKLIAPIKTLKSKYVALLIEIDPIYASEIKKEAEKLELLKVKIAEKKEERRKEEEKEKKKEEKKQSSFRFGCAGFLIPVVLFGLIVSAAGDNAKDIPDGVVYFLLLVCIAGPFIGYFGRKNYLKSKENEETEIKDTRDVNTTDNSDNSSDSKADNTEEKKVGIIHTASIKSIKYGVDRRYQMGWQ